MTQSRRATEEPATKSRWGELVMARGFHTFGHLALLGARAVNSLEWILGGPLDSRRRDL